MNGDDGVGGIKCVRHDSPHWIVHWRFNSAASRAKPKTSS